jgi:nitrite reductase (NADH) small subunit
MTLLESSRQDTDLGSHGAAHRWTDVCALDDLTPDRGVCALVDGAAVAVFSCWPDGALFAVGNLDPYSGASVMSRGIVGSVGDRAVVASPIFKNRFDLATGESLDDARVALAVHPIEVRDGRVRVAAADRHLTPG